jgi:hypothetical protein
LDVTIRQPFRRWAGLEFRLLGWSCCCRDNLFESVRQFRGEPLGDTVNVFVG